MDQDALEGLRALLAILNRQNVNREVDRLFRPSASSTGPSVSTSVPATTTSTFSSASTASSQSLRDLGPIFSPRTVSARRQGRGRPRSHPYGATAGHQFTRVVVLLAGPSEEDVPRGRVRQAIRDAGRESRVCFRSGMTGQEVRTSILYALQVQGHLRTIT